MKWIYMLRAPWVLSSENAGQPAQTVYLRPIMTNEEGETMVGNITEVMVIAAEFYFGHAEDMLDDDDGQRIYFEELANKDYYILEREVNQEEHYRMAYAEIYLKKEGFDKEEFFEWVRSFFSIKGYPCDELEEGRNEEFLDMDPFLRMFTLENVKKYEDKFGKEWWKKGGGNQ